MSYRMTLTTTDQRVANTFAFTCVFDRQDKKNLDIYTCLHGSLVFYGMGHFLIKKKI